MKIKQSSWRAFVRGEYIQLRACSLIACINFSEVAVTASILIAFRSSIVF